MISKKIGSPSRCAFSLLEIIAIISVAVVFLALLLPVVSKTREKGNMARCVGNLRQIGAAFNSFAAEHDGQYPKVSFSPYFDRENFWQGQLAPYLGFTGDPSRDLTYCMGSWTGDNPKYPDRKMAVFQCPSSYKRISLNWAGNSYGINRYLWSEAVPEQFVSNRALTVPSKTFLVMDCNTYVVSDPITAASGRTHQDRKNVLYCDGHVDSSYQEIVPLPEGRGWVGFELWGDTEFAWTRGVR